MLAGGVGPCAFKMQQKRQEKKAGSVRIIGGQWRSRVIDFPALPGLRPTPNRLRETLFNWLQFDIAGARCLDLYAGSGVLGLEALSRGAASATLVDTQSAACLALRANVRQLGAAAEVVQSDVMRYLAGTATPYDLVFLDPPFAQNLVIGGCQLLEARGWLAATAMGYVEAERILVVEDIPRVWQTFRSKTAGGVASHLYQRQPSADNHSS